MCRMNGCNFMFYYCEALSNIYLGKFRCRNRHLLTKNHDRFGKIELFFFCGCWLVRWFSNKVKLGSGLIKMVPQILLSCTEWNPISVLRFTVCELQCQPDVWQLHLWCRPVPGTGRRRPVWASIPRLRMDRPLPGGWGSGHSTQTGLGASYPLPSVSLYHLKAWLNLINEDEALFCQREVTGIQSDASVAWLCFYADGFSNPVQKVF